jgi:DNA-binding LacI/PurR family transcriptional regulator
MTRNRSREVTIRDVAALSGVSVATVTRTFQGSSLVRPATRARVLESAERLGYRPNPIAQALATGSSQTIGVLIPSLAQAYWAEVAEVIEHRAAEQGYAVLLANSRGEPEREQAMLQTFLEKRLDGVIVGAVAGDPQRWPSRPATPIVLLEWDATPQQELLEELRDGPLSRRLRRLPQETIAGDWLAHVSTDDAAGGALIGRALLELGHRRIAFLMGPPVRPDLLRLLGLRTALEDAGHAPAAVVSAADDTFEAGRSLAHGLLDAPAPPTALVCCSDTLAVGALRAAHELGLDVPRDVSIAGFDDIELAAYLDPPLTTVRNPMRQLGELALDLLLQGRAGETGPICRRLTGTLIERGTTGVAPTAPALA